MAYSLLEIFGIIALIIVGSKVVYILYGFLQIVLEESPKTIKVELKENESAEILKDCPKFDPNRLNGETKKVFMWDPSTYDYLGETNAMNEIEVKECVNKARIAQASWKKSSFKTRRLLMRTMLKYITENQESCARVAVRESGKTVLDALIGEVLVTCEKLIWLTQYGEKYLSPEVRESGRLMMMKRAYVEYIPLGVIGAIVPWNYPFHNVFNPVSAALFSGNAIVIKVSEYASWSIRYYKAIIDACLDAVGAPRDLVQFVVGYGATGGALVKSGVDQLIFVGSPGVGVIVAKTAADNLTPVVLELGGKDAFVVCDDMKVDEVIQTACRGVWQNMGQNCAGPERFFIYEKIYDEFVDKISKIVTQMKFGNPLSSSFIDCGSICMGPKQLLAYQRLVDDAVQKGAKLIAGGYIPQEVSTGSFYPPTVLADVPENAIIAQEEIFGPIMCIFKVKGNSDAEAVRMANNCEFALSSCAFAGDAKRAKKVASQLVAGMSAVNDLEGCTYVNQSLPFGGRNKSGYGRFAGPEGLRGLCMVRSVCEDIIPFIRNGIPPPLQYPATGVGHLFAKGLIRFFYSTDIWGKSIGLIELLKSLMMKPPLKRE